ncbi:ABC transporter permease subunit [Streptacidiphilus sp. PAMC 29251]
MSVATESLALSVRTSPAPSLRPPFSALLRSEWTKIRSIRSTVWTVLAFVVVSVGSAILIAHATKAGWASSSPGDRAQAIHDPAGTLFSGAGFGLILICVLGSLAVTSEYSTGTIRSSLLAVPRRTPMLVAKATVFTALLLAIGSTTGFVALFVGAKFLPSEMPMNLGTHGVFRETLGFGLYTAMLGLFSLAIGTLIRHTAGALTASVGLLLVVGPLTTALPGHISDFVPTTAGQLIVQADGTGMLSPWGGFAVFTLWTAGLLLAATYSLKHRDLS